MGVGIITLLETFRIVLFLYIHLFKHFLWLVKWCLIYLLVNLIALMQNRDCSAGCLQIIVGNLLHSALQLQQVCRSVCALQVDSTVEVSCLFVFCRCDFVICEKYWIIVYRECKHLVNWLGFKSRQESGINHLRVSWTRSGLNNSVNICIVLLAYIISIDLIYVFLLQTELDSLLCRPHQLYYKIYLLTSYLT